MSEPFENEVKVVVGTQKILVDPVGRVTIVNAGPVGPSGVTGSSLGNNSNPAAAILITPSVNPDPGNTIQAIYYQPGTPSRIGDPDSVNIWEQVTIPQNWGAGEAWTFDELNDAGVGEHVLLMIPVDGSTYPDDYYPTVYAEVTLTGFTPVELMGSSPVHISCGGAGIVQGATWIGRNDEGVTEGTPGVTDENYAATRFEPIGITDGSVSTYSNRTGNLNGMSTQKEINDWITTIDLSGTGGVTDHGALTGLGDDDHTQYHNDERGDERYSSLNHNHDGSYAATDHNHDGTYEVAGAAATAQSNAENYADGLGSNYATAGHDHDGTYAPVAHNHDGTYVPVASPNILPDPTGLPDGRVAKTSGGLWIAGTSSSSEAYTPATPANWVDPDPTTFTTALDALGGRTKTLETANPQVGIGVLRPRRGTGYYQAVPFPNAHTTTNISTNVANSLSTIMLMPFPVQKQESYDRVGLYVATAATDAGAVVEFGYCPSDVNGLPVYASSVSLGEQSILSTGLKEVVLGSTLTLTYGMWWLLVALKTGGTTAGVNPAFYAATSTYVPLEGDIASNNMGWKISLSRPSNGAVTSGTAVSWTSLGTQIWPRIGLRVS